MPLVLPKKFATKPEAPFLPMPQSLDFTKPLLPINLAASHAYYKGLIARNYAATQGNAALCTIKKP